MRHCECAKKGCGHKGKGKEAYCVVRRDGPFIAVCGLCEGVIMQRCPNCHEYGCTYWCKVDFPGTHPIIGAPEWRLLDESEVLLAGDETICLSTGLRGNEDWRPVDVAWAYALGAPISSFIGGDMDRKERVFRRRVR